MHTQDESPSGIHGPAEASAPHYRRLFETAPHAILVVELRTALIADANPGVAALTGQAPSHWIGRKLWETGLFTGPQHAEEVLARLHEVDHLDLGRWEFTRQDGQRCVLEVQASSYAEQHRRLVQLAFFNVTERSAAERRRFLAHKMDVLGRVAGKLAHDFNNTLTTILGYSELLLSALSPEDPARADLEQIQKAGQRAASINQHLLAFRRKPMSAKKAVNLNQLLRDIDLTRKLSLERIEVEIVTDSQLGTVRADRSQIEQVLLSLVSNARDAMPGGGKLRIETARAQLSESSPHIIPVPPGPYAMLAVSDTGPGLTAEQESNLFEPLFSTKPKGAAAGLGLFTTYAIMKLCGGTIDYHSHPGKGTVFQVYFPVAESAPQPARPETARRTAAETRPSATILLVEDEEAVRTLVREILRQAGYNVVEAPGGEEALRIAATQSQAIDLLLTDVIMPNMNGPALARFLQQEIPGLRVLYMSGHTDEALLGPQVLQDELSFIQKPFSPSALVERVRALLKRTSRRS